MVEYILSHIAKTFQTLFRNVVFGGWKHCLNSVDVAHMLACASQVLAWFFKLYLINVIYNTIPSTLEVYNENEGKWQKKNH